MEMILFLKVFCDNRSENHVNWNKQICESLLPGVTTNLLHFDLVQASVDSVVVFSVDNWILYTY